MGEKLRSFGTASKDHCRISFSRRGSDPDKPDDDASALEPWLVKGTFAPPGHSYHLIFTNSQRRGTGCAAA